MSRPYAKDLLLRQEERDAVASARAEASDRRAEKMQAQLEQIIARLADMPSASNSIQFDPIKPSPAEEK